VDEPVPTKGARGDELLEAVHAVKKALLARDEAPAGDWAEQTSEALASGTTDGWYYPGRSAPALAFYSTSGHEAYGHVHVEDDSDAVEHGERLVRRLLGRVTPPLASINIGFTGISAIRERDLMARVGAIPGSTVIERVAMERALSPADAEFPGPIPDGLRLVPIRAVTIEALADLDFRSVQGSVDALLIGPRPAEYRRVTEAMVSGSLGRFLDEASTALLIPEPPRLAGALLSAERTPRKAIFVNFLVDPEFQRRGYGHFLFRWGLRALWALGYERVHLWVTVANEAARKLYRDFGLEETARTTIYRFVPPEAEEQPQSAR